MTKNPTEALSRRGMVGGAGAGLVVVAATAAGAADAPPAAAVTAAPFVDPATKYPAPPFPRQSQPWPGLASQMEPKTDRGETSYQGSGRLLGRKALITGGDSGIGRAAAIAYAREGADVAINYLPSEEPDAREVVALIEAAGRKAVPIRATCAARRSALSSSPAPSRAWAGWTSSSTTPPASRSTPRWPNSRPKISTGR